MNKTNKSAGRFNRQLSSKIRRASTENCVFTTIFVYDMTQDHIHVPKSLILFQRIKYCLHTSWQCGAVALVSSGASPSCSFRKDYYKWSSGCKWERWSVQWKAMWSTTAHLSASHPYAKEFIYYSFASQDCRAQIKNNNTLHSRASRLPASCLRC